MKDSCYLVMSMKDKRYPGKGLSIRLTRHTPSLDRNEIALSVSIDLPEALFRRPALQASIAVPEDAVSAPTIDADVVENIRELASEHLGVDLAISVVDPAGVQA
ncbi:MAG TPA: hypothetical protein VFM97_00510 [Gammaproteobacteria bacterium]|nr:hypothetical protein [Gammaproteobacteria bacterium]